MQLSTPDSAVAQAAEAFVVEASPAFLTGHVYRTFHFGQALTTADASDYDLEASFVASLFHDLSLVDGFRGDQSFEFVGADHAARFLEARGWERERIVLVEDAIVHHVEIDPVGGAEYRFVHLGAALDVAGARFDEIDPSVIDAVLAAHPRDGMVAGITKEFLDEVERQPDGAFAALAAVLPFPDAIGANPIDNRD